jgi:hypothetical protein
LTTTDIGGGKVMEGEEELSIDKLASGDSPSAYAVGIIAARALKANSVAVFMTDVLGRVHLVPQSAVQVNFKPRLSDEELSAFSEEEAIELLTKQESPETEIIGYLRRRDSKGGFGGNHRV